MTFFRLTNKWRYALEFTLSEVYEKCYDFIYIEEKVKADIKASIDLRLR